MAINPDTYTLIYETALTAPNPVLSLREAIVNELDVHHVNRDELLAALDGVRLQFRDAGRESEEDAVADVIDFLVGWCSPHMRI